MNIHEKLRRLNRNLIICTSPKNWERFCNQCKKLNPSDPTEVFRYMLREALLTFEDHMYENNVEILHRHRLTVPMDTWMAEVGPAGDRLYFELTPYHDRVIFVEKDNNEMLDEILRNPVQVAYPECVYKPLVWLPFTTQVVFDGQARTDLTGLIGGKK